ncbi:tryptorubin family RiPP precursor [Streptomyces sp. DT24]|uniref:tryptorubin family RiPP precursor n=1 Tax=Streptomyces sp. DT24 TaxID=3416520 RepID=UPI003CE857C8
MDHTRPELIQPLNNHRQNRASAMERNIQKTSPAGDLRHIDGSFALGFTFRGDERRKCEFRRAGSVTALRVAESLYRNQPGPSPNGGVFMKLVNSLKKKIMPEKSLKSYAWYIWY